MRISDWSSDVCSSDLPWKPVGRKMPTWKLLKVSGSPAPLEKKLIAPERSPENSGVLATRSFGVQPLTGCGPGSLIGPLPNAVRSEEHTSELQSLMRISYAVFCLKKKKNTNDQHNAI